MQININASKIDITPSLNTYIEEKLGGLVKYFKRFDESGVSQLKIEISRTTAHHHKGDVFQATANLSLPKHTLRAEETAEDVRTAIDGIEQKLKGEIEKYRTRFVEPDRESSRQQ